MSNIPSTIFWKLFPNPSLLWKRKHLLSLFSLLGPHVLTYFRFLTITETEVISKHCWIYTIILLLLYQSWILEVQLAVYENNDQFKLPSKPSSPLLVFLRVSPQTPSLEPVCTSSQWSRSPLCTPYADKIAACTLRTWKTGLFIDLLQYHLLMEMQGHILPRLLSEVLGKLASSFCKNQWEIKNSFSKEINTWTRTFIIHRCLRRLKSLSCWTLQFYLLYMPYFFLAF